MKTAIVSLDWQLFVGCPKCGKEMDVVEQDDGNEFATAIFQNEWDNLKGVEICCPYCGESFEVEKIEY